MILLGWGRGALPAVVGVPLWWLRLLVVVFPPLLGVCGGLVVAFFPWWCQVGWGLGFSLVVSGGLGFGWGLGWVWVVVGVVGVVGAFSGGVPLWWRSFVVAGWVEGWGSVEWGLGLGVVVVWVVGGLWLCGWLVGCGGCWGLG